MPSVTTATATASIICALWRKVPAFFISEDGYLVTNNHVVADGSAYTVVMNDGTELDAKLIGKGQPYRSGCAEGRCQAQVSLCEVCR